MNSIKEKNLDIQVLRAVAIIMVVYAHIKGRFPMPAFYEKSFNYISTWSGVDIFLSISGFLMCMTLNRDIQNNGRNKKTYISFWVRRLLRLMPALLFWVFIYILVTSYANETFFPEPEKLTRLITSTLFGYANLYWSHGVVNGMSLGPKDMSDMFAVTWSLSLEWQLYLVISITLFCFKKARPTVLFSLFFIVTLLLPTSERQNTEYIWWFRPGAFMLGAICFYYTESIRLGKSLRFIISTCSILMLLITPYIFNKSFVIPVISILSALILASSLGAPIISRGFVGKILVWIGERSYSIYLCHYAVIHLISKFVFVNTPVGFYDSNAGTITMLIMFILLTAISSHLSYKFIECNSIEIGRKIMTKINKNNN